MNVYYGIPGYLRGELRTQLGRVAEGGRPGDAAGDNRPIYRKSRRRAGRINETGNHAIQVAFAIFGAQCPNDRRNAAAGRGKPGGKVEDGQGGKR